jgi:tetratricopeptide (TPR) repeat protein
VHDRPLVLRSGRANPEAYIEHLKARQAWGKWTEEGLREALVHVRRATEIDPGYAPAYEMLSFCFAILAYWGFLPAREAYLVARDAAGRAIALDDTLGNAHAALGLCRWMLDWDVETCALETARAIQLSPSSEFARLVRALYVVMMRGDRRDAVDQARLAQALDPLSLNTGFSVAWILLFAGDCEGAADQASKTLEMHAGEPYAYFALGHAELARRRFGPAVEAFERAVAAGGREVMLLGSLGHAYGRAGNHAAALSILEELALRPLREEGLQLAPAMVHAGLGRIDSALEWLEEAYARRDGRLFGIATIPAFLPLRGDPRFVDLARRLQLPVSSPPE